MDAHYIEEFKKTLEKERDMLVAELKSIATPNPNKKGGWEVTYPHFEENPSNTQDVDETADEFEEYEMRLATQKSLESRLLQVRAALERIQNGTYGKCMHCKKEISIERLRANPAAEHEAGHTA